MTKLGYSKNRNRETEVTKENAKDGVRSKGYEQGTQFRMFFTSRRQADLDGEDGETEHRLRVTKR